MKKTLLFLLLCFTINNYSQHCWPSSANIDLDVNNIRAKLLNGGDMWWDGVSTATYQYPKINPSSGQVPENILFAGALWMSAIDEQEDLKVAAQTYRGQGHEYWPGPIVYGSSTIADTECTKFDRFFNIYRTELDVHINAVNASSSSLNLSSISSSILEWPGKGNQYLINEYNMEIVDDLAPFQDCNNNGIYDPENGDYPLMKGDQSIFWVINDIGNIHQISGGGPLEVEIQCMAYAYITNNAVNDATFYDYKVIKKTAGDLNDFYFSQFVDPDLGNFADDYVGCDTILNYAYTYNSTSNSSEPIPITQFLKTPGKGLSSFQDYRPVSTPGGFVFDDNTVRNIQTGFWGDGTPLTCGGNGFGGSILTNFIYPGNPATASGGVDCENWSECSANISPSFRRYLMTSGPYDLNATEALDFTIAVIIAPTPSTYNGCPDKTSIINPVVNSVNNFINTVNDNSYNCKSLTSIINFNDNNDLISIFPNPTNNLLNIETKENFEISNLELYDAKGSLVSVEMRNKTINLEGKAKGIYTLKIYSKDLNKIVLMKFVLR